MGKREQTQERKSEKGRRIWEERNRREMGHLNGRGTGAVSTFAD